MDNQFLISVIVPVYNVEKYLEKCIDSIINQTYENLEIILVDDGSPDNCPVICDEYAKKDERIVVIHKENAGVSSARNFGLDIAKGEYISFVDSDDVLYHRFYEIMISNIGDSEIAFCDYIRFSDNCSFENIDTDLIKTELLKNKHVFDYPKLSFYPVWNKLIKSSVINEQRFDIDKKNAEDSLFTFDLLHKCSSAVLINEKLYGYFVRDNGAVGNIDFKGWLDVFYVSKYINDVSMKEKIPSFIYIHGVFLHDVISLFYNSKDIDKNVFNQCRKYLLKDLYSILFGKYKKIMTIKEKIVLILNLFFKY